MIFKFDFEFQNVTSGIKYIRDMTVDCAPTTRPPGDQRGRGHSARGAAAALGSG